MQGIFTKSAASFSPDRVFRYTLERWWSGIFEKRDYCNFICLNPSTADENAEDPTVRRACIFSKSWGYAGLMVTNLFAYRATDPHKLTWPVDAQGRKLPDPIGPENDAAILRVAKGAALVVVAWGVHGKLLDRDKQVLQLLRAQNIKLHCLGVTKEGHPKHPLYVAGATKPEVFT